MISSSCNGSTPHSKCKPVKPGNLSKILRNVFVLFVMTMEALQAVGAEFCCLLFFNFVM
jgi:hypothetical protein